MPNIITPLSICESFSSSLDTCPQVISSFEEDGIVIERVKFGGRATHGGRVRIAAAYAYDKKGAATETVIVLPDSKCTIDTELMKMFVKKGYTVLMVDYRGAWPCCDFYTEYPADIAYANFMQSGRKYGYVDSVALETSWYEWVAVGIYARKYAFERSGSKEIAVVGIRDGGEIAWKLGVADNFECIIPVCAAGWRAYAGIRKYLSAEPDLNEERYRFIAGIDSQAYAPNVKCPVLMLCSVNDPSFDYDRAYDTFSRINPQYIGESAIAYSVQCNGCIGWKCTADMFMFLDKNLKNRQVFIPKPAEITVEVDEESNLIAKAIFDDSGVVEKCGIYIAEDTVDSAVREWLPCTPKTKIAAKEQQFYMNIFEKTGLVFVLCYVKYINGFTVWSKMAAKKISGKFRNMQSKRRVLYSDKDGMDGFAPADPGSSAVGGIFFTDNSAMPRIEEKTAGVKGLYAPSGLTSYRLSNPKYSPSAGNLLKLDVYCDSSAPVTITFTDLNTGEKFTGVFDIVGGVWQSIIAENKLFKNANGTPVPAFSADYKFTLTCGVPYAINNVMWL